MLRWYQSSKAWALITLILGAPLLAHYLIGLWWVGGMVSLTGLMVLLIWIIADSIAFRDIE